jgi:hypothetical protein
VVGNEPFMFASGFPQEFSATDCGLDSAEIIEALSEWTRLKKISRATKTLRFYNYARNSTLRTLRASHAG